MADQQEPRRRRSKGANNRNRGNPLQGKVRGLEKTILDMEETIGELTEERDRIIVLYQKVYNQATALSALVKNGQEIIAGWQAMVQLMTTRWLAGEAGEFRKAVADQVAKAAPEYDVVGSVDPVNEDEVDQDPDADEFDDPSLEDDYGDEGDEDVDKVAERPDDGGDFSDGVE